MKASTLRSTALVVVAVFGDTVENHSARNVNVLINPVRSNGKFFAFGSSDVKATNIMATKRGVCQPTFMFNNLRRRNFLVYIWIIDYIIN